MTFNQFGGAFQRAMSAAGPTPSVGQPTSGMPNPFSVPGPVPGMAPTNPMETTGSQHGGAEQIGARNYLGTYLGTMDDRSASPRTHRTLPRSASPRRGERVRSRPSFDEDPEPRRSRERNRDDRGPDDRPVGFGFRLNACEQALREHSDEITAHKIPIQQINEIIQKWMGDRETIMQNLDFVFAHVDVKLTEAFRHVDSTFIEARDKIKAGTDVTNEIARGAFERFQQLELRIDRLSAQIDHFRASPPSTPPVAPTSEPSRPTAPPPSWSQPAPPPNFGGPASATQNSGFGSAFATQNSGYGANGGHASPAFGPSGVCPPPGMETRSKPECHHYGSPGSPLGNGGASQWAAGAGTEQKPFDPRDWMVDGKKPSKELKTYDGDMANYDTWRRRVRDHFVSVNCNYSKIFDLIEKQKTPIM